MKRVDEQRLENDLTYRFMYVSEFIAFGQSDIQVIHNSAERLAPLVPGLVNAVYEKLFTYDATKRHFVPRQSGYEGSLPISLDSLTLDHEIIKFRKQHLEKYLVALVTKPYEGKMVEYLNLVGKIHTPKAGSRDLNVPLVQMNALLGFVSDGLTQAILNLNLDRPQEVATLRAFNKLLWIQNDLINRHYQSQ